MPYYRLMGKGGSGNSNPLIKANLVGYIISHGGVVLKDSSTPQWYDLIVGLPEHVWIELMHIGNARFMLSQAPQVPSTQVERLPTINLLKVPEQVKAEPTAQPKSGVPILPLLLIGMAVVAVVVLR